MFHLISSQFPTLRRHIVIWTLVIFCFLQVDSGDFMKTRLVHNGKCLQVKTSCWQPLPPIPVPTHEPARRGASTAADWREGRHSEGQGQHQPWSLGRAPWRASGETNTHKLHLELGAQCCTAPPTTLNTHPLCVGRCSGSSGLIPPTDLLLCV